MAANDGAKTTGSLLETACYWPFTAGRLPSVDDRALHALQATRKSHGGAQRHRPGICDQMRSRQTSPQFAKRMTKAKTGEISVIRCGDSLMCVSVAPTQPK